jgi:hypothetical protein
MAKTTKKKPASASSKAGKQPSAYKSRDSEGKGSQADNKFQKELGKAKDTQRKG